MTTSEEEKEDNSDDAKVTRGAVDLSCMEAVSTMALQSLVLEVQKERMRESKRETKEEKQRKRASYRERQSNEERGKSVEDAEKKR